jgi:hypothetical protein
MNAAFTLSEPGIRLADMTPDYTVRFYKGKECAGTFDFGATPPTFTGDIDASARVFVDAVLQIFANQFPQGLSKAQP